MPAGRLASRAEASAYATSNRISRPEDEPLNATRLTQRPRPRGHGIGCVLLLGTLAANAAAQGSMLTGRIVADGTDKPIAGVEISIPATVRSVISDSLGGFAITGVPAGRYLVVLRKLGHQPFSTMITLANGDGPEYVWAMKPAAPTLAKVEVTASLRERRLGAFDEHRRARLGGSFLTAEDLEQERGRALADVLQALAGADIVRGTAGAAWFATRRGYDSFMNMPKITLADRARGASAGVCYAAVVVNNVFVYRGNADEQLFDISSLDPTEILALEVYKGGSTMPLEYNATRSTCGLLVIWTK